MQRTTNAKVQGNRVNINENERKIMALAQLQEMFSSQLEPGVVSLILSECEFNVDEALEKLFTLSGAESESESFMKYELEKATAEQQSDVTCLDNFNDDEKHLLIGISSDTETRQLADVKSSQGLTSVLASQGNKSGLPDFPPLEIFTTGHLGTHSVYSGSSPARHCADGEQFMGTGILDRSHHDKQFEDDERLTHGLAKRKDSDHMCEDLSGTKEVDRKTKEKHIASKMDNVYELRFGVNDEVLPDGPSIPCQNSFVMSQKTEVQGHNLLEYDPTQQFKGSLILPKGAIDTAISENPHTVYKFESAGEGTDGFYSTSKQRREERKRNDTELQTFNNFVKEISCEGPKPSDWKTHIKSHSSTEWTSVHPSFPKRGQVGVNTTFPSGPPGLLTHDFRTKMNPYGDYGKMTPDMLNKNKNMSKQQPGKVPSSDGFVPSVGQQLPQCRTIAPYFQQRSYHSEQMPLAGPNNFANVAFPRSAAIQGGIKTQRPNPEWRMQGPEWRMQGPELETQGPQWRTQGPEWRTQNYQRNKNFQQQRPHHFSQPNFVLQNQGSAVHANQTDGTVSSRHDKKLFIMRGLPGSGKSFVARKLRGFHGVILSTDDFFNQNGRYIFDASLIGEAHEWNQSRAKRAMEGEMNPIIIDNTNTQAWEMKPYVALGLKFGYWVEFKEPTTPWKWNIKELLRRNQHEVGEAAISRMLDRYEHDITVAKVMNSRRVEFVPLQRLSESGQNKHKFSSNSKTDDKERNVSESTVEEVPKVQRVRQPRTRRKHQDEGAVLSSGDSSDIATEIDTTHRHSLKDSTLDGAAVVSETESILGSIPKDKRLLQQEWNQPSNSVLVLTDKDAENSDRERLVCTGNKSVSESEDSVTDTSATESECIADSETSDSPRPQRINARRRKQRERWQGHGSVGEPEMMALEANHENPCDSTTDIKKLPETGTAMGTRDARLLCKPHQHFRYSDGEFDLSDVSVESLEDDQRRSKSGNIFCLEDLTKDIDMNDYPSHLDASFGHPMNCIDKDTSVWKGHPEGVVTVDEVTGDAETDTKNVSFPSLEGNIDNKFAGVTSETQYATLKPVASSFNALKRDDSLQDLAFTTTTENMLAKFTIPNTCSQEGNSSEAKPETKMESLFSGDEIQAQSTPPLSQLLASATKSKRPVLKARRISHRTSQDALLCTPEAQGSNSEMQQKSPECPESTNLESLTSQFNLEVSSVRDSIDTAGISRYEKNNGVISSSNSIDVQTKDQDGNKVYEFLKTCFPHVDRDLILDLLARYGYGEEAVPQVIDKLLSVPISELEPDEEASEESVRETSQPPGQVNTQPSLGVDRSKDKELRADAVLSNNSLMSQATNGNPISCSLPQAAFSGSSGVPSFPDTSFFNSKLANPTFASSPSQTSSIGTSSNIQFPGIMSTREYSSTSKVKSTAPTANVTSNVKFTSRYESHTTAPDIVSEDSSILLPGFHIGPSAGMEQTSTLQEEYGNVQGMQKDILCSFPDVPFHSSLRSSTNTAEARRAKHVAADQHGPVLTTSGNAASRQGMVHSLDNLQLTLEPALALQLAEMFGSIRGLQHEGEIAETDLVVKLDGKLAKMLYEKWKATIQEKTAGRQSDCLQQIMEEEMALELNGKQKAESNDSVTTSSNVATTLKRQKLYAMFPGVDKVALDELFQANRYELTPTVEMVKISCGLQENPGTVVAPGPTQPLPPAQNVPASDQTKEDWSWFCQGETAEHQVDSTAPGQDSYQALDEPGYADYRAEAATHARQRDDCFKKAALAFSKKQGALAQLYAQQGHQHTQKLKEANWRAARKILQNKNWDRDENTIDLHGLHVPEALCALEEMLLVTATGTIVSVVTGRGSHSKGGKAKIKPAVIDYLVRNKYRFEEVNQGLIKVFL